MNRRTLAVILLLSWAGTCGLVAQTPPTPPSTPTEPAPAPAGPMLRASCTLDRPEIFLHDRVRLTWTVETSDITIDSGIRIGNLLPPDQMELSILTELPPERRQEDGRLIERRRFEAFGLARTTGVFTISPVLQVLVITRQGGFFQMNEQRQIQCNPVMLRVSSIPAVPPGLEFSGAVGRFELQAAPAQTDIALGDLVKVTSTIRGTGWLEQVTAPRMADVPGVKLYEAVPVGSNMFERAFEQTIVPTTSNAVIPELTFTYFDTGHGEYRTLRQGPFPLTFHARTSEAVAVYRPSTAALSATTVRPASLGQPTPARLAPASTSMILFQIQPGTALVVLERRSAWLLVEAAGNRGWIPAGMLTDGAP